MLVRKLEAGNGEDRGSMFEDREKAQSLKFQISNPGKQLPFSDL
jgi:hypothetical protein